MRIFNLLLSSALCLLLLAGPSFSQAVVNVASESADDGTEAVAYLRLGDLHSGEAASDEDLSLAFGYYTQAAAVGSELGKLQVGEMLALGRGTERNVQAGLAVIQELADAGSAEALALLGRFHSQPDLGIVPFDPARAFELYRQASERGSSTGTLRAGEMLARGEGTPRDVEAGRAMVAALADDDNPQALIVLGDLLSFPQAGPIDGTAALAAYERAAATGSLTALTRLGDFHSDGRAAAVDLPQALAYYKQAMDRGDQWSGLMVGEMLARGHGAEQDIEGGMALIREVAEQGDAYALVTLGDLSSRGDAGPFDLNAAIEAYQKASELGRTQALLRLGDLYRDGRLVRSDRARAIDYYRKTAEAGDVWGLYSQGLLLIDDDRGGAASARAGFELLVEAYERGLADAVVPLADSYLHGTGVGRDTGRGIEILEEAMEEGNLEAARHLVDLFRFGRSDNRAVLVRKDPGRADSYLQRIAGRLTRAEHLFESLLMEAARRNVAGYQAVVDRIGELPPRDRQFLVRRLRASNPNAYVFLVQSRLNENGIHGSRPTGLLNSATIASINRYCRSKDIGAYCADGPLTSKVGDFLSYMF